MGFKMHKIFVVSAFVFSMAALSACGQGDQVVASPPQETSASLSTEQLAADTDIPAEVTADMTATKSDTPFKDVQEITWVLLTIDGETPETMAPITIQFGTDGRLHGVGGCNGYNTSYQLENDMPNISDMIASTMMACDETTMKHEYRFHNLLGDVNKWSHGEGGTLVLETADGNIMVFKKK